MTSTLPDYDPYAAEWSWPNDPQVADTIAQWADTEGAVAIRIMMTQGVSTDAADPGINRVLAAAARHSFPVNLLCWGRLDQVGQMAARHPETRLVIDHLGLQQPFEPPAPTEPWAELPKLLGLAAHDNIVVKISGACTLSHQPFPYKDIWDPLGRIFDAFGLDRCMWGTDWTRAVALLTYKQGVEAFRVIAPGAQRPPPVAATLVPEAIVAELKSTIAHFKVPKHMKLVDALPRNAMGKVQKKLLREELAALFA